MSVNNIVCLSFLVLAGGCAGISGSHDHYYTCAYDTVWDAAIDTLKGHSITSQNKEKGLIETAWIEMEGKERTYGAFGREGFGNRERAASARRSNAWTMWQRSAFWKPASGGMRRVA